MFINKRWFSLRNELDGEGNDLGGASESGEEAGSEGIETPEYLFGDVTSDEATDRFGYLRELPDQLRGLESRVSDTMSPIMEQLQSVSEKFGSQPVFEPQLERFAKALGEYDPKLAESVMPALIEDLKSSMSITPLGPEALSPHITPMLEQQHQMVMDQVIPTLVDMLPFDANGIVNRDPNSPDSVLDPTTDLQKDFSKWWEQADVPTRKALGTIGIPYVQALQKFGKWRAGQIRKKGEAAGEASARLSGAAQKNSGSRRENPSRGLETEADGFNSVFKK